MKLEKLVAIIAAILVIVAFCLAGSSDSDRYIEVNNTPKARIISNNTISNY